MAKQTVNIGNSPNDGTGDPIRTAWDKVNDNFNELYGANLVDGGTQGELLTWDSSGLSTTVAAGTSGQILTSNGAGAEPTFQPSGSVSQLSDLSDVNTSTPTARFVLVADGVDFESRVLVEADISDLGTYAALGVANEFTRTQNFNATTLTSTANSIAWDLEQNQVVSHTATEDTTLANPTNMVDGATYIFRFIQDAGTARTLAFDTAYLWPGGSAPVVTTALGATDILTFISDGINMYGTFNLNFS
jgi:hypothetical protein